MSSIDDNQVFIGAIINGISSLLMIIMFIHLYQITKSKLPHNSIIMAYISIISYAIFALNITIQSIYYLSASDYICIYDQLNVIFAANGKIYVFIFLIRLYNIFKIN